MCEFLMCFYDIYFYCVLMIFISIVQYYGLLSDRGGGLHGWIVGE